MAEPSSMWTIEYDVWSDGDWWYARRVEDITEAQRAHGVRKHVQAPTFEDLKRECVAQRVLAARHASGQGRDGDTR